MITIINDSFSLHAGNTKDQPVYTLYKTHGKYENGQMFEFSNPEYITAWYGIEPTNEQIQHEIMLNDWSRWNKELNPGQRVEISESIYYHLLGCVPPHIMRGSYFEVGEAHHHTSKGLAVHRACWMFEGKYYTGYPYSSIAVFNPSV